MTTTTLTKWGNGQGVRLPKPLTEQLGIHVGTIPDYEAMFRDYTGGQPTEDGFAAPAGTEAL